MAVYDTDAPNAIGYTFSATEFTGRREAPRGAGSQPCFNVYPAEVEAVLNAHPGVARSAVVGRSVAGDEEVVAFVEPSVGSAVTETELAAHAAKHLAAYKQPSEIVLMTTMPTSPTGKIKKDELSKMAADRAAAQ